MEANAVAVAATRAVAKVNPMPPSDLNQMNHPTLDMVGKDLGSKSGPHYVQIQNKHIITPYAFVRQCQYNSDMASDRIQLQKHVQRGGARIFQKIHPKGEGSGSPSGSLSDGERNDNNDSRHNTSVLL